MEIISVDQLIYFNKMIKKYKKIVVHTTDDFIEKLANAVIKCENALHARGDIKMKGFSKNFL